jgi:tetratricopeptide (TPR) repeat protein
MNASKTLKQSKNAVYEGIITSCNFAKKLEESGEYANAVHEMGNWWQGIGVRPNVNELPDGQKAAVLSRIGALSGWLGSMQQIPDSQEKAKDLISEAAYLFQKINDHQNWAETRSDLAVCYWREGAFDEARVILNDVLGSNVALTPELHGKILLRSVNVEISTKHYEKAMLMINQAGLVIEETGSNLLRGKFYFHRALIMRSQAEDENNTGYFLSSIADYGYASTYYKKANHDRYVAMVENNIGNVYRLLGDFPNAHSHLDEALHMYVNLKDKGRAALVYDNKARAFIAQGNLSDAELAALTSVNMLREGGENATLAESLTTLGVVLSRGGNIAEAIDSFVEAKETALNVGDMESAGNAVLTQIEELQSDLTPTIFRSLYLEADELLKNSPKLGTINRLQQIAKKQFETNGFEWDAATNWENFSLPGAVLAYEGEIIQKALEDSNGRVTKAAILLGLSHQNLSLILRQRHRELKQYCTDRKPRSRSKVKSH